MKKLVLLISLLLSTAAFAQNRPYVGGITNPMATGPVGAATGNIDLYPYKLTLDLDKDTYIYSSLDDILDFYASGSEVLQITAAGADLTGILTIDDTAKITSTGAGITCFGGAGTPTNDEDICFDTDVAANQLTLSSTTGASLLNSELGIKFPDEIILAFGGNSDTRLQFNAAQQTPDTMLVTVGTDSKTLLILDNADLVETMATTAETNPTIRIHSATATDDTQHIKFNHDQTDGVITTGAGDLVLMSATDLVAFEGTTSSFPALKRSGAGLLVQLADDSGLAVLTASQLWASNVRAGSTGKFFFNTRSEITSPSDGNLLVTDTAGTETSNIQVADVQSSGLLTANGASTTMVQPAGEELTCVGGGSATLTTSGVGLIPDGVFLVGVTTRITTALTTSTGFDVGFSGGDTDAFGVQTVATLAATTDNLDATATWGNPQLAATGIILTFNGGACTGGVIMVVPHYITATAPTSN